MVLPQRLDREVDVVRIVFDEQDLGGSIGPRAHDAIASGKRLKI